MKKILNLLFLITFFFVSNSYSMSGEQRQKKVINNVLSDFNPIVDVSWLVSRIKGLFVSRPEETVSQEYVEPEIESLNIQSESESGDEPEMEDETEVERAVDVISKRRIYATLRKRNRNLSLKEIVGVAEQENTLEVFNWLNSGEPSLQTKILDYINKPSADIDIQDDVGNTLLHYAISLYQKTNGHSDKLEYVLVNQLLKKGANIFIPNNAGETSFDLLLSTNKRAHKFFQTTVLSIAMRELEKINNEEEKKTKLEEFANLALEKNLSYVVERLIQKYNVEFSPAKIIALNTIVFKFSKLYLQEQIERDKERLQIDIHDFFVNVETEYRKKINNLNSNNYNEFIEYINSLIEDEYTIKVQDTLDQSLFHVILICIDNLFSRGRLPSLKELKKHKELLALLLEKGREFDVITFLIKTNNSNETPFDIWNETKEKIERFLREVRENPYRQSRAIGREALEELFDVGEKKTVPDLLQEIDFLINQFAKSVNLNLIRLD